MKLVRVVDYRRMYEKDGVKLPSPSLRLVDDKGNYVWIRPAFDKNKREWFYLNQMVTNNAEIDKDGNYKESK